MIHNPQLLEGGQDQSFAHNAARVRFPPVAAVGAVRSISQFRRSRRARLWGRRRVVWNTPPTQICGTAQAMSQSGLVTV